jgi:hypothetical protein
VKQTPFGDDPVSFPSFLTLTLFTAPSDNLDELLLQYNFGLSSLLDKHAPVRSKVITVRPPNPWFSAEVLNIPRKLKEWDCVGGGKKDCSQCLNGEA